MADINKTFELQMKVDLKSFTNQLKKMPQVSEQEYKRVTRSLQVELRKAQRTAEMSAKRQKNAMKTAELAYERTAISAREVRKQSREMGAAFGSLEDVVSQVSPELGEMALIVGTVGQGFRALSRSLATGNKWVLTVVGTLAAAAIVYHAFTAATREAERQQELLKESLEATNRKLEKQHSIVRSVTRDQQDATRELQVFTGKITELEGDLDKLRTSAQDKLQKQLETQDKYISDAKELIKINNKAIDSSSSLTEEERKKLEIALLRSKEHKGILADGTTEAALSTKLIGFGNILLESLKKEQNLRNAIVTESQKTFDIQKELRQLQEELRKEEEEEEKRQQRIAEARQRNADRLRNIENSRIAILDIIKTAENEAYNLSLKRMHPFERLNAAQTKSLNLIDQQKEAIANNLQIARESAKTQEQKANLVEVEKKAIEALNALEEQKQELKKDRIFKIDDLNEKNHKENLKRIKKESDLADRALKERQKANANGLKTSIKGLQEFSSNGMKLLQDTGNENKDLINVLFRANQAAAIADIAMKTAVAIAGAPAQYGAFAPAAIATITANAGVQTALVMAQNPPLHMGGYISTAPDEKQRTVLSGEAVLDRKTVQELGGESGVNNLLNGKSQPQIIVMNPYKHFDRYNKSAQRQYKPFQNRPNRAKY